MSEFSASLAGTHLNTMVMLSQWPEFKDEPFDRLDIDFERSAKSQWVIEFLTAKKTASVSWRRSTSGNAAYGARWLDCWPQSEVVSFAVKLPPFDAMRAIQLINSLPFFVATLGNVFSDEHGNIAAAWDPQAVDRWGFGRSMIKHGWGCAFRGEGHDRLVSRRWIDFGPWRVIRRPNDTTFVQFHDLAITDPAEAYAQAAPGHQRMGIDVIGGYFLPLDEEDVAFVNEHVQGFYLPDDKKLEIVVAPGVEITQQESMRWACGLRLHHRLTQPTSGRIDTIAYIFIDEAEARAHLHELWLRELECWYISPTGKHRLDADYHPVPNPPDWVKRLDGK